MHQHRVPDRPLVFPAPAPAPVPPPQTPERGRTRYPAHLSRQVDAEGKPRPLLHRRGTSHMYETLEDLLKEAGYKETRIYTPETERREAEAPGVGGAVVKLFSTWMARRAPDASPLAHRTRAARTPLARAHPQSPGSSQRTVRPPPQVPHHLALQHQHSLTRAPLAPSASSSSAAFRTARLALRHAASAPHIERRARTAPRPKNRPPPSWLEALFTPRTPPSPASTSSFKPRPRRPVPALAHGPPTAVALTITNVVCRSAPASRAPSAARPPKSKAAHLHVPTLVCEAQSCPAASAAHSPHLLPHVPLPDPDDDEDDEHELNLTMMLIPSKRQHSIRSLRSVLRQHPESEAREREREYARIMRRRVEEQMEGERRAGEGAEEEGEEEDEGEGEGHWDSGEYLTARVKRRRSGLPRQWGWTS